eukprot:scaffold14161_cov112-Isochrysis_galbana.AAC.4
MPTDGRSECRADAHKRQVEREACGSRALPHGVLLCSVCLWRVARRAPAPRLRAAGPRPLVCARGGGGGGGHRANAAAVACNGPTSKAGPGRAAMADAVQYPAGLRIWTERALQRCSSQVEARQVAESIQVAATR